MTGRGVMFAVSIPPSHQYRMVKKQYVFLQLIFSGDYCVVELEDGDGLKTLIVKVHMDTLA